MSFLAVEKMLKNKDLELLQCSLGQESYCGNSKKNLNFGEVVVGADDFLWVCSPKMGLDFGEAVGVALLLLGP